MDERTTLQVPRPLLARIKKVGHKGQTYAEIIDEALKALQRQRFLDAQYQTFLDMKEGREPFRFV